MGPGLEITRIVAVVALLCVAAAVATPKGRLPLALRGVYKILRKDRGEAVEPRAAGSDRAPAWKRVLAFALVVLAAFLCML